MSTEKMFYERIDTIAYLRDKILNKNNIVVSSFLISSSSLCIFLCKILFTKEKFLVSSVTTKITDFTIDTVKKHLSQANINAFSHRYHIFSLDFFK